MDADTARNQATRLPSLSGRIDAVCDEFEQAWQSGTPPLLEEFLDGWNVPERSQLLRALLEVELEYRQSSGCTLAPDEYERRFPDHSTVIAEVFAGSSLETKLASDTQNRTSPLIKSTAARTLAGKSFGDYEILEEIARGGMGVVYKARQTKLNRIVALKMIKSGELAGEDEVQRFHTEAEAAAQLDHPNIVPIYEVGEENGRHFFSMGFVEGAGLNDRLKDGPLPPAEAAELIRTIAEAVQYAHEKGIVHRDLKPANVLLPVESAEAETQKKPESLNSQHSTLNPRITDFGLAKNVAGDSGMTATGQILGTPSYMPPEQAAGKTEEIGPAADVYSLGAMLYATLTGRPPFQAANVMETLKQVLEKEPVSPRELNPAVDRDLETICLKCLEKESPKRYATARSLADDLARYIAGRPILARPIGKPARLWRWCRRNRTLAIVGGTALILLLTLSIGGPIVALREAELKQRATNESAKRLAQKIEADKQRRIANRQAVRARGVTDSILRMFEATDALAFANPTRGLGEKLTARQILERGASQVEAKLADDPASLAELQITIGRAFRSLGAYKEARPRLESAYRFWNRRHDANPRLLAQSAFALAWLNHDRGNYLRAEELYTQALELYSQNPGTSRSELNNVRFNLGWMYAEYLEFEKAQQLLEAALRSEMRNNSRTTHRIFSIELALCGLSFLREDYKQALSRLTKIAAARKNMENKSPLIEALIVALNGALIARVTGRSETAINALHRAQEIAAPSLGTSHAYLAVVEYQLALLYEENNNDAAAERHYVRCLQMITKLNVLSHPRTGQFVKSYGGFLARKGRLDKAAELCRRFIHATTQAFPKDHPLVGLAWANVGRVYFELDRYKDTAAAFKRARELLRDSHVMTRWEQSVLTHDLAQSLDKSVGPGEEVWTLYRQAITEAKTLKSDSNRNVAVGSSNLAGSMMNGGYFTDEVGQLLSESLRVFRANRKWDLLNRFRKTPYDWQMSYTFDLLNRYYLQRNELRKAAECAEQRVASASRHVEGLLRGASDLCNCIATLRRNRTVVARSAELEAKWRDRAIALIRSAVKSGCPRSRVRRWRAFAPLQQDDHYRRLVGLRPIKRAPVEASRPMRTSKASVM